MRANIRTLAVAAVAGAVLLAGAPAATAYTYQTDQGTVEVLEPGSGYIVVVDGSASNSDPLDGYVGVNWNGQVCASDEGGPTTGDDQATDCSP